MGELLKKMFRINYDKRSLAEIEEVAEGAALMQEQHARDVLLMAETAGVSKNDPRVKRAKLVTEKLR